ncbi:MAG: Cell division protein FtsQ [Alphaproteobacteria bacterium ADurb.BinA280]|jgi:cell division protein FtsQ|nr:FtsQ-type POTRA domain-containing protein [Aquimonas sp.]OPZ14071.1 MAG: Cell division protein FtsQ [Alphaproteobacteria bacterium ADurb.BinA280]
MTDFLRAMTWVFASLLLILPVLAVLNGWLATQQWPVRRLHVQGEFAQIDEAQVSEAVMPYLEKGFFALPLEDVQRALVALPWVADVHVSKRWPDVLDIQVREHRAAALWGESQLLSDRGVLFPRPAGMRDESLPHFHGQPRDVESVVAMYADAQRLFGPQQRQVAQVRLSGRGSWSLNFRTGEVVMVGRSEPRLKMRRFARSLPLIAVVPGRRWLRADLRYSNGFALKWSAPESPTEREMDNT